MIKTFTQDDVLRYVYEETSAEENLVVEEGLMAESDLMAFFLEALEFRALMNRIERKPREASIDRVLDYSRNYSKNSTV